MKQTGILSQYLILTAVRSRLYELDESKFPFVSRIEFIRSKLSFFSAHVAGFSGGGRSAPPCRRCSAVLSTYSTSPGDRTRAGWSNIGRPVQIRCANIEFVAWHGMGGRRWRGNGRPQPESNQTPPRALKERRSGGRAGQSAMERP